MVEEKARLTSLGVGHAARTSVERTRRVAAGSDDAAGGRRRAARPPWAHAAISDAAAPARMDDWADSSAEESESENESVEEAEDDELINDILAQDLA